MKFKMVVFVFALVIIFCCGVVFAAGEAGSKIGLINIQKIIMESKAGKDAKLAFDKELDAKRSMLSAKEKSAKAIEDDLKANGAKMKADVKKAKEDSLAENIKDLRRLKQDMEEELKKKDAELTSGILKDVLAITKKVGDEGGYSFILQATPQVVYMDKAADITNEVLKRYDSGK